MTEAKAHELDRRLSSEQVKRMSKFNCRFQKAISNIHCLQSLGICLEYSLSRSPNSSIEHYLGTSPGLFFKRSRSSNSRKPLEHLIFWKAVIWATSLQILLAGNYHACVNKGMVLYQKLKEPTSTTISLLTWLGKWY
jgi:hypothetical protein